MARSIHDAVITAAHTGPATRATIITVARRDAHCTVDAAAAEVDFLISAGILTRTTHNRYQLAGNLDDIVNTEPPPPRRRR
jgi:hypothetical protein